MSNARRSVTSLCRREQSEVGFCPKYLSKPESNLSIESTDV